jgi:hypothetical protein
MSIIHPTTKDATVQQRFPYDASSTPNHGDMPAYDAPSGLYKPAAPSGGGAGGVLLSDPVVLSPAQIGALSPTPIQLAAAPGAGKVRVPDMLLVAQRGGTAPYTVSGGFLSVGPASDPVGPAYLNLDATILTSNGAWLMVVRGDPGNGGIDPSIWENQPLMLVLSDAGTPVTPTGGDFEIVVRVRYQDMDL